MATHVKTPISDIRPAQPTPKFSLARAFLAGKQYHGTQSVEESASDAFAASAGVPPTGVYMPIGYYTKGNGNLGFSDGAATIQTSVEGVVDALRPFSAITAAGAAIRPNLPKGPLTLPRFESTSTVATTADSTAVAASCETFSTLVLTPTRIASQVLVSTQLLRTANQMPLEAYLKAEILKSVGQSIDQMAIDAILAMTAQTPGQNALDKVNTVTFSGAATWAKLVAMKQSVRASNVPDDGSMAFVIDSATYGKWNTIPKVATFPEFLIEDDICLNAPVFVTEMLAAAHQALFLRASDVQIAIWGVDVLADSTTRAAEFLTVLTVNAICAAGVIRGPAVCKSTDTAAA